MWGDAGCGGVTSGAGGGVGSWVVGAVICGGGRS